MYTLCSVDKAYVYISCYVDISYYAVISYYVDISYCVLVSDYVNIVESFESRRQCKSARAKFVLFLCLCKCGVICTPFHATVFILNMVFMWWKITGKRLYISCARQKMQSSKS